MSEEALISLKKIAKGAGIVLFGIIFSKVLFYLYRLIVAHIGVEEYGLLSLGFAVLSFATMFASLGLSTAVARYLPMYVARKDYMRLRGLLNFSTKAVIMLGLLAGAALFLVSDWLALEVFHNARFAIVLKVFAFAVPFCALSDLFSGALQGLQQPKRFVAVRYFTEGAFKVVGSLLLVSLGYGFFGVVAVYAASYAVSFLLGVYLVEKTFSFAKFISPAGLLPVGEWLNYSLPLVAAGFFGFILGWTDSIMLGTMKDAAQVGLYNAALPTAMLLFVAPSAVLPFYFPIASSLIARGKALELQRVHRLATKWIWLSSLPIVFVFFFFAPHILSVLFGSEYVGGALALAVLAIGYFVNSVFWTSGNVVMALGKSKIALYVTIGAALLNVVLNCTLIQVWGIVGAALATSLSLLAANAVCGLVAYKLVGTKPFSAECFKGFLASLLACAVVYGLIKTVLGPTIVDFLIAGVVLLVIYALALLLLKVWEREDEELLRVIEKKMGFRLEFLRWFK